MLIKLGNVLCKSLLNRLTGGAEVYFAQKTNQAEVALIVCGRNNAAAVEQMREAPG